MTTTIKRAIVFTRRVLAYAWASPYTAVGLLIGATGVCLGARVNLLAGAVEFSGGFLGQTVSRLSGDRKFCAITLGHTILGTCADSLCSARSHEQVHIRQYERWGIFFVPAYLLSSLWQGLRGRRMYYDNIFEREAYGTATARKPR